jgi:SAM-dependent methyltransferase
MRSEESARWDQAAERFDDGPDHGLGDPRTRDAWRELLVDLLPAPPARVADLGCGTGTLTVLLAEMGYRVDGVDFSGAMLALATDKAGDQPAVSFQLGDAAAPPLAVGAYDVVLSRHVLWALPDPTAGLRRWIDLLASDGRLVLIEGLWHTGAGLRSDQVCAMLGRLHRSAAVTDLSDPRLWGEAIADHRFAIVSRADERPRDGSHPQPSNTT